MNPQEKYQRDLWWLLQLLRLEECFSTEDKPLDFSLKPDNSKKPTGIPNMDSQRKMLYKLQELKVLKLQPSTSDPFDLPLIGEPTRFNITLAKDTFGSLYQSFEEKYGYEDIAEETPAKQTVLYDKPVIQDKILDVIADELANRHSHASLTEFFTELGVTEFDQEGSKKVRVFSVLRNLSASNKDKLFQLLEEAIHPLNFGDDIQRANDTFDRYNNYLKYDGYKIIQAEGTGKPQVIAINDAQSNGAKVVYAVSDELTKEKISLLRKAYQVLMGIVEVFCLDPSKPDTQLNKFYLNLDKLVWETIDELRLYGQFSVFKKPFSNLYAAEKECGGKVSWDLIRPEMSAMFGHIETLYQESDGSDILTEPDKQKQFNEITLYLSELKEKIKATQPAVKVVTHPQLPIAEASNLKNLRETKSALETQFDDKIQSFLLIVKQEIELTDDAGIVGIKYKRLSPIFDVEELPKYLKYMESKKLLTLKHISKQQDKHKILADDHYVTEIIPDHTLINPEEFYSIKRYYSLNYYPEDVFIFQCDPVAVTSYLRHLQPNANDDASEPAVLYISENHGIYANPNSKKPNYPIKGKRSRLVHLLKNGKMGAKELCQILEYDEPLLSREISQINAAFRTKLTKRDDFIIHLDTGGYDLNREKYLINFI